MKDDMQFEHLNRIIADLRKDVETLQKLQKEDAVKLKQWQEDAAFGRRCRFYIEAMAKLQSRGMPGFIDMCAPILIQMLNTVAMPEDLGVKRWVEISPPSPDTPSPTPKADSSPDCTDARCAGESTVPAPE